MIVVPVKEGENIDKALRQCFDKPSVIKRNQKIRAVYLQKLQQEEK